MATPNPINEQIKATHDDFDRKAKRWHDLHSLADPDTVHSVFFRDIDPVWLAYRVTDIESNLGATGNGAGYPDPTNPHPIDSWLIGWCSTWNWQLRIQTRPLISYEWLPVFGLVSFPSHREYIQCRVVETREERKSIKLTPRHRVNLRFFHNDWIH